MRLLGAWYSGRNLSQGFVARCGVHNRNGKLRFGIEAVGTPFAVARPETRSAKEPPTGSPFRPAHHAQSGTAPECNRSAPASSLPGLHLFQQVEAASLKLDCDG